MLSSALLPAALGTGREAPTGAFPPPRFLKRRDGRPISKGFIGLGDALFQVFPFETRRAGEARTCPPRTVGYTNLLLGSGHGKLNVGPSEATEVALRHATDPCPAEAAKEKVVFCSRQGETLVFQADRQNRCAALCACGNATGTAAALLGHRLKQRHVRQSLQVPDGRLDMSSTVTPLAEGGWRVEQAWLGIRSRVEPTEMQGRPVAVCTGSFNDYLIVRLSGTDELEQFDLPQVLALWSEARTFSGFDNPLQSRLVALAPRPGQRPFAKFYTCGRAHPGAPLTGMATLAMASGRVDWLGDLLQGAAIEHRRGVDTLPTVQVTSQGYEIGFPAIDVLLKGV
jgi:hypothetical protein